MKTSIYLTFLCLFAVLFADDEETPLPSVGRGIPVPPICDVALPQAYYDELAMHTPLSGIGRGHQLQELGTGNSSLEATLGQRGSPAYVDEYPVLDSGNSKNVVIPQEKPVSRPEQPEQQVSLKSLGAQFASAK